MFFTTIIAPDANNILYSIAGAKLDADGNQIPESVVALAPTTSTGASTTESIFFTLRIERQIYECV